MSMAAPREPALSTLLDDVFDAGGIDPETLLRYHQNPASMPAEQRAAVECRVAESPDVAAQLELLRRVERGSLDFSRGQRRAWVSRWISVGAGMAAALAAVLLLGRSSPEPSLDPQSTTPVEPPAQLAEATAPQVAIEPPAQQAPVPDPTPAPAPTPSPTRAPVQVAALAPRYQAPADARSVARLGLTRSATRGARPLALVPEHVARTRLEQPVLYWALAELPAAGASARIELSRSSGEIVGLFDLPAPTRAGLQRVSLADLGQRLAPGEELRWLVSVELGDDVAVSSAGILRVDAAGANASAESSASAGLWYDALDALVRDGASARVLADWLAQAGIDASAAGLAAR